MVGKKISNISKIVILSTLLTFCNSIETDDVINKEIFRVTNDANNIGMMDDAINKEIFQLTNEYEIDKDNLLFNKVYSFDSSDDTTFYFTYFYSQSMYRTKRPFKTIVKVGENGSGPYEYIMPYTLQVTNESIYFSDLNDFKIERIYIDSTKNNEKNYEYYTGNSGGNRFLCTDKLFFYFNGKSPLLSVYDKNSRKKFTDMLSQKEYINYALNRRSTEGGIDEDLKGDVYLAFAIPHKIYKISPYGVYFKVDSINLSSDEKYLTKWDEDDYRKSLKNKRVRNNRIANFSGINRLKFIGKEKQFIFITITNRLTNNYFHYIYSKDGKLLYRFKTDEKHEHILYIKNNTVFFQKMTKENKKYKTYIIEYKFNEKYFVKS